MTDRLIIVGGPRTGKSTRAREYRQDRGWPTFCGDPRSTVKEPEDDVTYLPEGMEWSEGSEYVVDYWFSRPGPWVCEGHIMARALRKWLRLSQDGTEDLPEDPCDTILVFTDHHPNATVTPGQAAMHKGVMSVWDSIAYDLEPITVYA